MRLLTIALGLVLALALVGAGCGGDDETASDTDTVVTEDTTTEETTTDETTTDETETTDGLATGECEDLIDASTRLSQALGSAGSGGEDLDEVSDFFDEFADEAPEEIRADFQVLAEAYRAYADVLADINVEPGQTPDPEALQRLQEAVASIDQEELAGASQRISVWAETNC